jgi:alkaline phosphatase D
MRPVPVITGCYDRPMRTRRRFLVDATVSMATLPLWLRAQNAATPATGPFQHGVASGDPLKDRVLLWTRVTPAPGASEPVRVRWRVGSDEQFRQVVASGTAETGAARDFTVKVDASGLQPGRTYFYAFDTDGQESVVGRTRTLPERTERLRLAVVSCSNYPAGYFNVYRCVANRGDLDAVLHLGDYIYEFANGIYGDGTRAGRLPLPISEAVTLADYRLRNATYRSDIDLQEAHRQHPFITVWDDHESASDSSPWGAAGHTPKNGDWATRFAAAYRAYVEWMPIRESAEPGIRLYRNFRFGDLADLVMLDTRGLRDKHLLPTDPAVGDPRRTMLGAAQERWLADTLRASQRAGSTWRLLGQQVLFTSVTPPALPIQNMDVWSGYPAARARLLEMLAAERVTNLAILTGDLHSSWALEVPPNPWAAAGSPALAPVAVEFVTPAISSPPFFDTPSFRDTAPMLRLGARHLKYLDGENRGYILLDVTAKRLQTEWYFVPTVTERSAREKKAMTFVTERGSSRLSPG